MNNDIIELILNKDENIRYETNIYCKHRINDSFSFVERNKQITNTTDLMILDAMRDINVTVTQVAKKFKVSDSHVHNIFDKYINIGRFPLSEAISIDEVYTNFDSDRKYDLFIIDFIKNKPIDLEERLIVKYLVCDMYKPYLTPII